MPQLALGDVWRARIVSHLDDQVSANVLHFKVANLTGPVEDQELADYFSTEWETHFKALMSDDANYRGVSVQRIHPGPTTRPAISIIHAGPGTVLGEPLPRQCSGIITFYTNLGGPRYRGRIYVPFASETDNEVPGRPLDTYVTRLSTLGGQLRDQDTVVGVGGTATMNLVLWHRDFATSDIVVAAVGRKRWATQKRRGDYGSQNALPF